MQEKRKEVAAVTKSLQICKTYKPVWMQYVELPMSQKSAFYSGHSTELQAYSSAAKNVEKEGIDQSVDLDVFSIYENTDERDRTTTVDMHSTFELEPLLQKAAQGQKRHCANLAE